MEDFSKFQNFHEAFLWCFQKGLTDGIPKHDPWAFNALRNAIVAKDRNLGTLSANTVRGWHRGSKPDERFVAAIADVFFGNHVRTARETFHSLWRNAGKPRGGAVQSFTVPPQPVVAPAPTQTPAAEWPGREAVVIHPAVTPHHAVRLFELTLDRPSQGSTPDDFDLFASVLTNTVESVEEGYRLRKGLKRVFILKAFDGCQVVIGSTDALKTLGVDYTAGGWEVTRREGEGLMKGERVPKMPLARMTRRGHPKVIDVKLRAVCYDTDLDLTWVGDPPPAVAESKKREKILKRWLQGIHRDSDTGGEVFLGEAALTWPGES